MMRRAGGVRPAVFGVRTPVCQKAGASEAGADPARARELDGRDEGLQLAETGASSQLQKAAPPACMQPHCKVFGSFI